MVRKRRPPMLDTGPLPNVVLPLSEPTILAATNWVKDTTLLYGGSISTAFTVAGIFARGLEDELRRREAARAEQREDGGS